MVTAESLALFAHGTVKITAEPSFRDVCEGTLKHFIPAECNLASGFSSKTVERVRILSYFLY